jgi:uncharacterized protein YcfL
MMTLKPMSCMLTLCLLLAATGGCEMVNTAERSEPIAQSDPVALRKVEPDASLRAQVQIISANQGIVSGNLLKVQVVVRNNIALRKTFNYKWEWYDINGMMVDTPTTRVWQVARLQPKESIVLTGIGPNPNVVDFRLKLVERP